MREKSDASFPLLCFVLGEGTPECGPDAENFEKSRGHVHREDALGFSAISG